MKNLISFLVILLFAGIAFGQTSPGVWPDTVWGWSFNSIASPAPGIPYPSDAWMSIEMRLRDGTTNAVLFLTKNVGQNGYAMAFKNFNVTLPETVEVDYFLLDIRKDPSYPAGPGAFSICTIENSDLNWITNGRSLNTEARDYWTELRVNIADYQRPFKIRHIDRLVLSFEALNFMITGCQLDNLRLVSVAGEVFWLDGMGDSVALGLEQTNNVPNQFELGQNYPNPFNPTTTIEFKIPASEFVTLKIYNLLGQEVVTLVEGKLIPGRHKYTWNAAGFAGGVYFYRLRTGDREVTKKMILMK